MGRARTVFACTECGAQQPRWMGRCPECGAWSTLVEEPQGPLGSSRDPLGDPRGGDPLGGAAATSGKPQRLAEIDVDALPRLATGIGELDRVLGGGLVPGSVVLLAGEPGVGKSTLALQLAAGIEAGGGGGRAVLYVTGEESPEQLRLRAARLPVLPAHTAVMAETSLEGLSVPWRDLDPAVVLVDSIQTLRREGVDSAPGSVAQVRECAAALAATAKSRGAALVMVGHVTKEGAIAGPRVLEHLVDVVLQFEGDRGHAFRILRAVKNRFGSTREVGVFQMTGAGLEAVENPSELFLAERRSGAPGSCVVPLLEGSRPMLVEIQALVAPAGYGMARRTAIGVDDGRLALLLAVLDRRTDVDVLNRDVYVNAVGGVRVTEPGADLALALALASSRLDLPIPESAVACGEVGLGGEVRRVARTELRVREAVRLGLSTVLVPAGAREAARPPPGARLVPVADVAEAIRWLRERAAG